MRRRIAILASAVLAAVPALVTLGSSQPASATGVCAGTGTASLSVGLVYPLSDTTVNTGGPVPGLTTTVTVHGLRTANFGLTITTGACSDGTSLSATGTLHGWCGHSAGTGVSGDGHLFGYTSAGSILVVTGGLVGVAHAAPDTVGGQSCNGATSPGASVFIVAGAVAKVHCTTDVLSTGLTGIPATQTLIGILPTAPLTIHTVHVTTDAIEVHYRVHACFGVL